jgi:glycosyltransferase involved in cell wall biosynthesis
MEVVNAYLELARECGVAPERLRFIDRVPNYEVPRVIRAADVVVVPFPYTDHYATVSPLKLFEYMAAGVPIVATELPSIREALRHASNAWLVKPGDPVALAEGLQFVLENPELQAKLAKQAYADVQANTWERRAGEILKLFGYESNHCRSGLGSGIV